MKTRTGSLLLLSRNFITTLAKAFFLFLVPVLYGKAQLRSPLAIPYLGVGTYSSAVTDIFGAVNNQAALSRLKEPALGIYAEKRFMLKELNLYEAVCAYPLVKGGVAITAAYSGFKNYNESQVGLAYGTTLGEKIDLGVQFNYNLIRIPGYGNTTTINFEIGCIIHLTEKIHAGIHASNPVHGRSRKDGSEKMASVYTSGLGFDVSEKLFVGSEIKKEESQPVSISMALHYAFIKEFFVRGGIGTGLNTSFLAIGLKRNQFRVDVSGSFHPQLGFTPSVLLVLTLKQNTPGE